MSRGTLGLTKWATMMLMEVEHCRRKLERREQEQIEEEERVERERVSAEEKREALKKRNPKKDWRTRFFGRRRKAETEERG